MTFVIPFNIIEVIHTKIGNHLASSLTNIIYKEYPTYSPFIYDITNAYFCYNHLSIIEAMIPNEILDSIDQFMLMNQYDKLEFIDDKMILSMKQFLLNNNKKEYVNLLQDILFVIYKKYNKIPLYDKNFILPQQLTL